jgi:8-oxo-dGTP pyrophosphatase MutT (NUDIX family)
MNNVSHDSETPAHGQQVITACAFIHHNFDGVDKLFMPKRAAAKKFMPNIYEIPGGHVDYGEDIVEGLKREIKEELGMTVKVGDPFAVFTYMNDIKGSHSIEVIYFATFNEVIENIKINPEDHSEFAWFSESEFDRMIGKGKPADDDEVPFIKKGFALLRGESLQF